ncbi:hypothetical protein [Hyalangium gracile]|uniref:hypothetical protein n=1 Tax=Hyalangium gracile TaxID=394092 RepID=UPI001CC950CA|nr:hypothetical protein [Hyalangium gracile]
MSRIIPRTLSAVLAFIVPTLAAAQATTPIPEYTDPVVYQVEAKFPVVSYPDGYVMDDNYSWESTLLPYDQRRVYTPEEQEAIIADEVRITGGRRITNTDGTTEIAIEQPTIPEASRETAPPPEEIYEEDGQPPAPQLKPQGLISTMSAPATATRRWVRKDAFGNSMFGAGYYIDTFVQGTEASGAIGKKVVAYVDGKVHATAFSYTREVVRARIDVSGQQGGTNSGMARVYAMGQQIYSKSLAASFTITPVNSSRDFFVVSKRFNVGPVPMKVRAALSGGAKLSLSGKISPTEAKINGTPGGYVNVTASVSVDVVVFAFGVQGSLMLINVNLPATAELFWPLCSAMTWKLSSNISLNTMSGNIRLYARVKIFWFFKKTWYLTIANWSGYTLNAPLFSKTGTIGLGICPGFAPADTTPLMSMAEQL